MNIKVLQIKKYKLNLLFFLFFSQLVSAQLTDFSLAVTKTDETCTGNGSLTFQVSNTTAGAVIVYSVYHLPNITTPITTTTSNTFGGLTAGSYRVIATQTLGSLSNFQQQDIEILNAIVPLAYQISDEDLSCGLGKITIGVTQGIAMSYEIMSGPVIVAPQSSNVFTMLPSGVYVFRVYNACGDAVVQTYTLQNSNTNFTVSPVSVPGCELIDCNTLQISVALNPAVGSIVSYPLTVMYTVFPPTGAPIVLTQYVPVGPADGIVLYFGIPFYNAQSYSCNVKVTDACGNVVMSNDNQLYVKFDVALSSDVLLCSKNITIETCFFKGPYTVNFISAPPGFNPVLFNANHPGPFYDGMIVYDSTGLNVLPDGTYSIQVTDVCGRSIQRQIEIAGTNDPGYDVYPTSCGFGLISMPEVYGTPVVSVVMTGAPPTYTQTLPYNVSFNILNGQFVMQNLPAGTYTFTVIDICGNTFYYSITIPLNGPKTIMPSYLKGCEIGKTSIKISVQGTSLTSIIITAAPSTFLFPIPYDVSSNINSGFFYMNSLPEGMYTFHLSGICDYEQDFITNITAYHVTSTVADVEANCGSFNLLLQYNDNETAEKSFWLQKYNASTNQWVHPITGVVYPDGTIPILGNSHELTNNSNNLNIASIGTFRILKVNSIYSNGTPTLTNCIQTIKDFVFTGGPKIADAYNLPCTSGGSTVVIVAEGMAPLSYKITLKDNQPFVVNNGNSNVFSGLAPGIYNFQVQDGCGNIVNRLFDLAAVPPPSISQSILCDGQNGALYVQNLPFLNYQWWNGNNPALILSTSYMLSFNPFSSALNSGTYYVRIYSNTAGVCSEQIISYVIPPAGSGPSAGQGTVSSICGSTAPIDLFTLLTGTYSLNGIWEEITNSGMLTGQYWFPVGIPQGTYQFKYKVSGLCDSVSETIVVVNLSTIPEAPIAAVEPYNCVEGMLHLTASSIAGAVYEWSGPNNFASNEQNPTISSVSMASNGTYFVKAIVLGCTSEMASVEVNINVAPDFTISKSCVDDKFMLTVVSAGNGFDASTATYLWTGPENFSSQENPINITGETDGVYTVVVTTANGCAISSSTEVTTTLCGIPKGVSPNGDGDNDTFDLSGLEVIEFKIFNRYGRMIFEQNDYTNQWHGQDYNNNELPDATYYYYIRKKSGEEKTGWVLKIN